jgi:hypothetical protein
MALAKGRVGVFGQVRSTGSKHKFIEGVFSDGEGDFDLDRKQRFASDRVGLNLHQILVRANDVTDRVAPF